MLDDRVLAVLARLEEQDRAEREAGLPAERRSRQIEPTTGRFLFALAASQAGIEVLEVGGSRGYSSIWLAAGARVLGGRVISLEKDPEKCAAWRENIAEAGLEEWAELVEGDAFETLRADAGHLRSRLPRRREERLRGALRARAPARRCRRPRRSRQRALARRSARRVLGRAPDRSGSRQRHVPLDRGLELTVATTEPSTLG